MAFLKSQEVLSESDLVLEKAFIEKHQIRYKHAPILYYIICKRKEFS
jgi:hypothetical protein